MAAPFSDLAAYFKSGLTFQDLYKLTSFGAAAANTAQRAHALTQHRRETRGAALLKRRQISAATMSPYETPGKKKREQSPPKDPALEKAIEDRRAKLEKWQQMKKAKLQAEKETKKPPFKVGVAAPAPPAGNCRLLANFSRVGAGEVTKNKSSGMMRETRTVVLRNAAKKEETMKGMMSVKSTSSEGSLASEKSVGCTRRTTRSQTKALELRNGSKEGKSGVKKALEVKKESKPRTPKKPERKPKNVTKTSSSTEEEEQKVVPEVSAKKIVNRTRNTITKTLSSTEKNQHDVVAPAKKVNTKSTSTVNKTATANEVIVPVKKNNSTTKISVKPSSSSEESLQVAPAKTPTNTKKAKTPSSAKAEKISGQKDQNTKKTTKTPRKNAEEEKEKVERQVLAEITPEKNAIPAIYISPFVTVSRGKNSARKEYHNRHSLDDSQGVQLGKKDVEIYTSPRAGAAYFRNVLEGSIERLQGMCKEWEAYKEKELPPEEACDMINVAIGQSQLLISKKFQQFRSLIDQCEAKNPEAPVTCEDLHGFWDMVNMQVVNIEKRFDNLKTLRANNWVEIIPEKKTVKKVQQVVRKKNVKASNSNLKDIIKAARQLRKTQENSKFDGGFFSVSSPAKNTEVAKNTPRKSARRSRFSVNSPGLQILQASMNVKQIVEGKTPSRSILKSGGCFTAEKKTVLFQDAHDGSDVENNVVKELEKTPKKSRRGSRCANKLQF